MANVSYTEDIQNRYLAGIAEIKGDLEQLRLDARNDSINSANAASRLKSMSRVCEQLIAKLDSLTDVATHPWISAALRAWQAQNRVEELEIELARRSSENVKKTEDVKKPLDRNDTREIDVIRGNYRILKDEAKKLREENSALKEEIANNRNPKALFGDKVKPLRE